jgi:hypothetical protein
MDSSQAPPDAKTLTAPWQLAGSWLALACAARCCPTTLRVSQQQQRKHVPHTINWVGCNKESPETFQPTHHGAATQHGRPQPLRL